MIITVIWFYNYYNYHAWFVNIFDNEKKSAEKKEIHDFSKDNSVKETQTTKDS